MHCVCMGGWNYCHMSLQSFSTTLQNATVGPGHPYPADAGPLKLKKSMERKRNQIVRKTNQKANNEEDPLHSCFPVALPSCGIKD